ncbi:STAS domain-containing protein [Phycisphaerales bacterium AB-hyl4]|uniref:STAS domain-containing protein n=1 Tax=Natronomicrosphaera hydrolytica TaxID=3242702 RepID=A0ABV4U2R0_9BACT
MLCDGIELDQSGAVVTVTIRLPEVTHTQMQELIAECEERVRCHHGNYFVFDLAEVTFLASSCLGSMVSFLQDLEHVRGRIALANCQDNVAFVFKVTRLDTVFPIFEDVKEATASF